MFVFVITIFLTIIAVSIIFHFYDMLKIDIAQAGEYGETFFSRTDVAYLVFMIIGIIGYFTVPSVANYIVHAGGGGALGQKVTSMFSNSTTSLVNTASQGTTMVADAMGNAAGRMYQSMSDSGNSAPYFKDKDSYMADKLKGKS